MNLNQITIPVTDVESSIAFYEQLGLRLIVKSLPRYARFECSEGDATFSIHHVNEPMVNEGLSIYFELNNLDDYVQELIEKGIEFDELPVDRSYLWREARLKDPDGNRLILYYAGANRKNPPWRVT